MGEAEKIANFNNWTECGNGWDGHYRYVIAAKAAYEIIVLCHYKDTPLLTAKANLYMTGMWYTKDGGNLFERELLGNELPIQELLNIAQKDYNENKD